MELVEYTGLAMRTAKPMQPVPALIHAGMGILSDTGELVDAIKRETIYGKPPDLVNVKEEIGDVLWFIVYTQMALSQRHPKCLIVLLPEYQAYNHTSSIQHAALRLGGKAGSINTAIVNLLWGISPPVEKTLKNLEAHLNDLFYLIRWIAKTYQLDFWEDCAEWNLHKLRQRYPDVYTDAAAIARADKAQPNPNFSMGVEYAKRPTECSHTTRNHITNICVDCGDRPWRNQA